MVRRSCVFCWNYVQIVTLDHGLQPFKTYDFQEKLIKNFHNHRFNIYECDRLVSPRHVCLIFFTIIFNDSVNIGIQPIGPQQRTLGRLATAYENLPKWFNRGILVWNKGNIELENGSKILAASTSGGVLVRVRRSISSFLDELSVRSKSHPLMLLCICLSYYYFW